MTTGKLIREFCKKCVNSSQKKLIEKCGGEMVRATGKPCPLFKYRLKGKGTLKATRRHCLECMGGSYWSVEDCQTTDCDMFTCRMGKKLSKTGVLVCKTNLYGKSKPIIGSMGRVKHI
jgi:hypothetical protein